MARYTHFKVWLDGKIVNPEEATLSVFTLTVLRGANVYEGLRAYWNPAKRDLYVWKLDEHLKRLGHSMKVMRMQLPYSLDDLRVAVVEWLRANDFHDDVHFRLVAYFGDGGSGGVKSYRPDEIDTGAFILGGPRPHDAKLERGLAMGVATWRRIAGRRGARAGQGRGELPEQPAGRRRGARERIRRRDPADAGGEGRGGDGRRPDDGARWPARRAAGRPTACWSRSRGGPCSSSTRASTAGRPSSARSIAPSSTCATRS